MKRRKTTVLALSLFMLTVAIVWASFQHRIRSTATVTYAPEIGVYWDETCLQKVETIDWGELTRGQIATELVYVKNTGEATITLALRTESWNPPAANQYITLSWNYNGTNLESKQVIPLTLTLTVSTSITGITSFSFDIIIEAYTA